MSKYPNVKMSKRLALVWMLFITAAAAAPANGDVEDNVL